MNAVRLSLKPNSGTSQNAAKAMLDEFFTSKPVGINPLLAWFDEGYIEASVFNNRVHLGAIFVLPDKRGKKLGASYLKEFLALADKHGAEVECTVKPFGDQVPNAKMGVRDLTNWYKRSGFKPSLNRKNYLIRPVQTTTCL